MTSETELRISEPAMTVTARTFLRNGPYLAVPADSTSCEGVWAEHKDNGIWQVRYYFRIYPTPNDFVFHSQEIVMKSLKDLEGGNWSLLAGSAAKTKHEEIMKEWRA